MNEQLKQDGQITIVVGDEELVTSVSGGGAEVHCVPDYLAALGEMGSRPASVIVGDIEPLLSTLESTTRALREIAPDARLLLVADAADEPHAVRAVRHGFDDYLIRPVTSKAIESALHYGNGDDADDGRDDAEHGDGLDDVLLSVADLINLESTHFFGESNSVIESIPSVDAGDGVEANRPGSGKSSSNPKSYQLGDVDLINQLLSKRSSFRDTAVQLICQRLGCEVLWGEHPSSGGGTSVEVRLGETLFGYLISSSAEEKSLSPYGRWLGHWLALNEHINGLNELAYKDEMTGVWNRRYFDRFLKRVLEHARRKRFRVTLMIYDIDDFKAYNDSFGHPAGDDILMETARLMRSVMRKHDIVARIGGDEFAVVFWDADAPRRAHSEHPHEVRAIAERFQNAVREHRFPKLGSEAQGGLTISGGLATYPWDGSTADDLIKRADEMLLESKRQGKNALCFGDRIERETNGNEASSPEH